MEASEFWCIQARARSISITLVHMSDDLIAEASDHPIFKISLRLPRRKILLAIPMPMGIYGRRGENRDHVKVIICSICAQERNVASIEIYTSPLCGFCYQAKTLLNRKGVNFDEIDLAAHPDRKQEMIARANGRPTVPQIFINGAHIGGCDDLFGLDSEGKLDQLLTA